MALAVARRLVLFLRRPANQAQFSAHLAAQFASRDAIREVQAHVIEHPEADLSVPRLAALAGAPHEAPAPIAELLRSNKRFVLEGV